MRWNGPKTSRKWVTPRAFAERARAAGGLPKRSHRGQTQGEATRQPGGEADWPSSRATAPERYTSSTTPGRHSSSHTNTCINTLRRNHNRTALYHRLDAAPSGGCGRRPGLGVNTKFDRPSAWEPNSRAASGLSPLRPHPGCSWHESGRSLLPSLVRVRPSSGTMGFKLRGSTACGRNRYACEPCPPHSLWGTIRSARQVEKCWRRGKYLCNRRPAFHSILALGATPSASQQHARWSGVHERKQQRRTLLARMHTYTLSQTRAKGAWTWRDGRRNPAREHPRLRCSVSGQARPTRRRRDCLQTISALSHRGPPGMLRKELRVAMQSLRALPCRSVLVQHPARRLLPAHTHKCKRKKGYARTTGGWWPGQAI